MERSTVKMFYDEPWVFWFRVMPYLSAALSAYLEEHGLALECDSRVGDDGKGGPLFCGLGVAVKRQALESEAQHQGNISKTPALVDR